MGRPRPTLLKLPFVAAIVMGTILLVVPLADSELSASKAADKLDRLASPRITTASLRGLRADLNKSEAVATALRDAGLPRLAALSRQSPAAFLATLTDQDPAFTQRLPRVPSAQRLAEKVVTNLERRRGQFESARSLPGLGLTLHDAVWVDLAVGALLVVCGTLGLARSRRATANAIGAIGLLLVVMPLALGLPSKSADTDALLNSLRPFSIEKVRARQAALHDVSVVFSGFRDSVVARVAVSARSTPAAVLANLASASPELSPTSLDEVDAALHRFASLVQFSARIQPLLVKADQLSAQATMWLLIVPGALLVIAVALSLLAGCAAPVRSRARVA